MAAFLVNFTFLFGSRGRKTLFHIRNYECAHVIKYRLETRNSTASSNCVVDS